MARTAHKRVDPKKPLLKPQARIGTLNAEFLIGELRRLHETAEDADIDRMPGDDELYRALLYCEAHASSLKSEEARRTAALHRVKLWQYVREQADVHQAKAIADARAANAEWAHLAPALAVNTPSAAYNKATRLRAATLTDPFRDDQPVRRTPEAVLEAERQVVAQAAAERQAAAEAARRHTLLAPVGQRLIQHRVGLDDDGEVTYWLDEIAAVLPSCQTATQLVSLETYVKAVVRELRKTERSTARPVGATDEARRAYETAAALVQRI